MDSSKTPPRQPPSARRLLIAFLAFGLVFALGVLAAVSALLVKVRSDAERDVDRMLTNSVAQQLAQSAAQQAAVYQQELDSAKKAVEYLAAATLDAYVNPVPASPEEVARYVDGPNGSYITKEVDGGSSLFYSGVVPIGPKEKAKAAQLAAIDPALKAIVGANPLVVQAYVNTWDSMNRIYPGFDVVAQYPARMDIPTYNFYYLADEVHDPSKQAVWTNVYVDPAGQGWMTSVIAPVYVNGRLEAVAGVDITVASIVGSLLSTPQPFDAFSVLLDTEGVIMAMPPPAEKLFGLKELTDVDYASFVLQDTFKPEQFDIVRRDDTATIAAAMQSAPAGSGTYDIGATNVLAAWKTFESPGWRILTIAPQKAVVQVHEPAERLKRATLVALWVVSIAFIVMVAALTVRARRLSLAFTAPLERIDQATARIAAGDFEPALPPAPVAELARTGDQLLAMGRSLREAQTRMLDDAQKLRVGEQRYRAIFENVAEPIITIDADGVVVDANPEANRMFGRPMEGIDMHAEFSSTAWREPGRHTVRVHDPVTGEHVLEIAVSVTGDGDQRLFHITAHDSTADEEARRLLREASATAERTARLKDEFLASMSHEIRTPLNGVIGVLSLLAERDLPPAARDELAVARASADDLLVLVNDVLDFAKIEAGQVSVDAVNVHLGDLVEGVQRLYLPFAAEQDDVLEVQVDPAVPEWVCIDPTRVRQVLSNLVNNALKFTDHGRVGVHVRLDDGAAADAERFHLRFEVVDTGIGIAPEVQARLFTRFTQGDPLSTRKFPGTGLGLAIAKRLTELMGGQVGLESEPGRGSLFWFTVDAAPGEPGDRAIDTPVAGGSTSSRLRVLVAEDNDVNRYLMVSILGRLGHEVVAVVNGREAVAAVEREPFDLVLLDVQMPVATGIDATQAIRALPGRAGRVPILAVTANVLPEQQAVYRKVGFDGLLPKPLTLEHVETAIATYVPHARQDVQMPKPATPPSAAPSSHPQEDAPMPDTDAGPVFDSRLIDEYRSVIGEDGARDMVALFERTLAERAVELRAAHAAAQLDETRRVGHALKGMAAAVGAVRLSEAGRRLQFAEADEVDALMAVFEAEAGTALAGIHAAWQLGA